MKLCDASDIPRLCDPDLTRIEELKLPAEWVKAEVTQADPRSSLGVDQDRAGAKEAVTGTSSSLLLVKLTERTNDLEEQRADPSEFKEAPVNRAPLEMFSERSGVSGLADEIRELLLSAHPEKLDESFSLKAFRNFNLLAKLMEQRTLPGGEREDQTLNMSLTLAVERTVDAPDEVISKTLLNHKARPNQLTWLKELLRHASRAHLSPPLCELRALG